MGTFLTSEYERLAPLTRVGEDGTWRCISCGGPIATRVQHLFRRKTDDNKEPYLSDVRWQHSLLGERGVVDGQQVSFTRIWCPRCGPPLQEVDEARVADLVCVAS